MSWFDQQPQPGTIGVQGGAVPTTEIGQPGGLSWANYNPGYQSNFLPGEPNPAQTPGAYPTPVSGASPAPAAGGNYQSWFQNLMGGANDQASLLSHRAELEAAGWNISPPNAAGEITKVQQPDGQWVRVIGNGEGHPVYNIQPPEGTASAGSIGGMADGSLLTPWTEQFQPPDPNQIANDPNYQFQLQQGLQGIQRGAASHGTLLTGGTLKSLDQFGNGLASSFNNTQYNRALGEYGLRKQNFQENQDRPYTKLSGLATLGKPQTIQPPTG